MSKLRLLFVGQNPASKKLEGKPAFEGTRSGKVLNEWIARAGVSKYNCHIDFINIYSKTGRPPKNLPAEDVAKFYNRMYFGEYDAVFLLGKYVRDTVLDIRHNTLVPFPISGSNIYFMEHPSGLNRNLNKKEVVKLQSDTIRYVYEILTSEKASRIKTERQLSGSQDGSNDVQRKSSNLRSPRKKNIKRRSKANTGSSLKAGDCARKGN